MACIPVYMQCRTGLGSLSESSRYISARPSAFELWQLYPNRLPVAHRDFSDLPPNRTSALRALRSTEKSAGRRDLCGDIP